MKSLKNKLAIAVIAAVVIQGTASAKVPKAFKNYKKAVQICSAFAKEKSLNRANSKMKVYEKKRGAALLGFPEGVKEEIKSGVATRDNKRPKKETKTVAEWLAVCDTVMPEHIKFLQVNAQNKPALVHFKGALKTCSKFGRIKKISKAVSARDSYKKQKETGLAAASGAGVLVMKSSLYDAQTLGYTRGEKPASDWFELCEVSFDKHITYLENKGAAKKLQSQVGQIGNYIMALRSTCNSLEQTIPLDTMLSQNVDAYISANKQVKSSPLFNQAKDKRISNESPLSLNDFMKKCDDIKEARLTTRKKYSQ